MGSVAVAVALRLYNCAQLCTIVHDCAEGINIASLLGKLSVRLIKVPFGRSMGANTNILQKIQVGFSTLGIWLGLRMIGFTILIAVSGAVFVSGIKIGAEENSNSYNVQGNYFYNIKLLSPPYFKSGGSITFFSQFYLSKNFREDNSFVYMLSNGDDRRIIAINKTADGVKYSDIKVGYNFSDYIRLDIPESFEKSSYDISVGFAYADQPLESILERENVDNLFIKVLTIYRVTDSDAVRIAFAAIVLVVSLAGLSIALAEILLPSTKVNTVLSLTAMTFAMGVTFMTMVVTFSFASSMWVFGRVIIPEYIFIFTLPFFIIVLWFSLFYLILGRIDTALYLIIMFVALLATTHIYIANYEGNTSGNMLDIILGIDDLFMYLITDKYVGSLIALMFFALVILIANTYRKVLFSSTFVLRFYLFLGMLIINIALFSIIDYVMVSYTGINILNMMNSFEFFGLFISYFTSYINL